MSTSRVALVEPQLPRQQPGVQCQLGSLPVQHGVVRGDRLSEHADRGAVRVAQLVLQPAVLECGAGVIAERQQQLVADLLEAAGAIRAHDHAVEAVAQIEREWRRGCRSRCQPPWPRCRRDDAGRPRAGSHPARAPRARSAARWRYATDRARSLGASTTSRAPSPSSSCATAAAPSRPPRARSPP